MNNENQINEFELIQDKINDIVKRLNIIENFNLEFNKKRVHQGVFKYNKCIYCNYDIDEHKKIYDFVYNLYENNTFCSRCVSNKFIYGDSDSSDY